MPAPSLPHSANLKLDLLFKGIRYSEALGRAAGHSFPGFYPYRFKPGEPDPTGKGKATVPYSFATANGVHARLKGDGDSPWSVAGSPETGYSLSDDRGEYPATGIEFMNLPRWMHGTTRDGFPMAQAGLTLHHDMAVINIAPACQYFLADKQDGVSMRCVFCGYGAPDARTEQLGQAMDRTALSPLALARLKETLAAALDESEIRHIYLVGGSMTDWHEEGKRYIELAREVQSVLKYRVPLACGSGALPTESLRQLHEEKLVDAVCFNLEVWSERLFAAVCPGKHRFVGYERWLRALEEAAALWGRGRVYSAMVAGIELEPEYGLSEDAALALALEGAEYLCGRGILPIYSLYWPIAGRDHPKHLAKLRTYFERLNLGYREIRRRHGLRIWDGFACHRCSYMQLECDLDRDLDH